MPISEIITGITTAGQAFKATRIMLDWANEAKLIPVQQQILELQRFLSDQQEELRLAREENATLRSERDVEASLTERHAVLWRDGANLKGPFCPVCYGNHRKLIPMRTGGGIYYCNLCKASRSDPDHVPAPRHDPPPRKSWIDRMY